LWICPIIGVYGIQYTHVYPCIPMYTHVYPCIPSKASELYGFVISNSSLRWIFWGGPWLSQFPSYPPS
jgi:predicted permease